MPRRGWRERFPDLDLGPLDLLGQGLAKGLPPPARTIAHLRKLYTVEQLVYLAERDDTPETVLRSVTLLLEEE